jgi:hypothetical protein
VQARATMITTDIAGISPLTAENSQQWRRDVERALGYGRVFDKFIDHPLSSPTSDEDIERWQDDRQTVAIWVSKAAGNDLQHIVAPFLRSGDPAGMWKSLMDVYEKQSPTSRFRYYQKILDIKLDSDQSFETLLQNSASILSDLSRLAPTAMTAKDVMEEMVIMAVSQLIPPTHPLYSQLLSRSSITFLEFSELILQHESAAKSRPGASLQASASAFAATVTASSQPVHAHITDPSKCFFCGHKHSIVDCRNFAAAQRRVARNPRPRRPQELLPPPKGRRPRILLNWSRKRRSRRGLTSPMESIRQMMTPSSTPDRRVPPVPATTHSLTIGSAIQGLLHI